MAQVQFREPKTAAEVFANAKATSAYFKALRSPPPKLVIAAPPVVVPPPEPIEAPADHMVPEVPAVPEVNPQAIEMAAEGRTFDAICRAVCIRYGVTKIDVLSRRRTQDVVRPRQVICYLAKRLTLKSLPEIGRRLGGRDHTTVLHAVNKIGRLYAGDEVLAAQIDNFEEQLRPRPREAA